jgi:hypothetical protein
LRARRRLHKIGRGCNFEIGGDGVGLFYTPL